MTSRSPLATFSSATYTDDIFQPQVMLPCQYHSDPVAGVSGGERKLMAALLSDGIEAYVNHYERYGIESGKNLNRDIKAWVETRDYSYVFSFDVVCECLGINPDYLRKGLVAYIRAIDETGQEEGSNWKKIRRPRVY